MKKKNMKLTIKRALGIGIFLCLFALCTLGLMRTVKDKYNYYKYMEFYEEEEAFDVLFFGSSRILDAVYPMELWDEYGITSYNMAQHSEWSKTSYWQMKNAFAHNVPKVAVVDLSLLSSVKITDDNAEMKSYLHKSLDHMPFGKIKYDALKDLTEGVDVWEYLFPYAMYHNRWNKLERVDFYTEWPCRKGAETRVAIAQMERTEWSTDEVASALDVENTGLEDMIALCEEYDVQLVFSLMPTVLVSANASTCSLMNAVAEYAEEKDIMFLNFAKEDSFIDYSLDFYDSSHLNPSGGKKLSMELGRILTENFEFPEKNEKTLEAWENAKQIYMGAKLGELILEEKAGNLAHYLLLLKDNDYTVKIQMPDAECIEAFGIEKVLAALDMEKEDIIFNAEETQVVVTVYRNDMGTVFHEARFAK